MYTLELEHACMHACMASAVCRTASTCDSVVIGVWVDATVNHVNIVASWWPIHHAAPCGHELPAGTALGQACK